PARDTRPRVPPRRPRGRGEARGTSGCARAGRGSHALRGTRSPCEGTPREPGPTGPRRRSCHRGRGAAVFGAGARRDSRDAALSRGFRVPTFDVAVNLTL